MTGGLIGLGVTAALAATVLPFSSEAAVVAALAAGWPPGGVWLAASVGNCVGALSTWALGWWIGKAALPRLVASRGGRAALRWAERLGPWAMAGSWLPVVGDPLMLAGGLFRLPLWAVVGLGLGTRVARYGAVIWLWGPAQ